MNINKRYFLPFNVDYEDEETGEFVEFFMGHTFSALNPADVDGVLNPNHVFVVFDGEDTRSYQLPKKYLYNSETNQNLY